jgi:hypothetical protein
MWFKICQLSILSILSVNLPAFAQWKDVTSEFQEILGGKETYSPVFLKGGSIRNIKSVNFRNTIYRKAVFSYSIGGSTVRSTYFFDCLEANYKTSEAQSGYWIDLSWITPSSDRVSFDWAAYKFLCPNSKDPWLLVAENTDRAQYFVNTATGYQFTSPVYGNVKSWILKKHVSIDRLDNPTRLLWPVLPGRGSSDLFQVYVACANRLLAIYDMAESDDKNIILNDQNPESIGNEIVNRACQR